MESVKSGFKKCPSCNSFQDVNNKNCPNCDFDLTNVPEETKEFPVKWLKFYTYVRIPLGIFISILSLIFTFIYIGEPIFIGIYSIVVTLFVVMEIFLFIGLHRRKLWGWKLNWYVIAIELVINIISRYDYNEVVVIGLLLAWILLWLLPNYFYFTKRKSLFK